MLTRVLNRHDPFHEIFRLQEDFFRPLEQGSAWAKQLIEGPRVDVYTKDETFFVEAELPGFQGEDVEVEIEDQVLTLRGEKTVERDGVESYHARERFNGKFERRLSLPDFVDATSADATMEHGVLTLSFQKREELKPKRIAVKVS